MKSITKLSTALVAAFTVATTIAWSGPGGGAKTEWEHGSIHFDDPAVPVPCLGESVHFLGEALYSRHTVTSPSGKTGYHFRFLPTTADSPPFTAEGNDSGKVYLGNNGLATSETFHLGPNEVFHVSALQQVYQAEDGERFVVSFSLHFTTNANGDLIVSSNRLDFECK